MQTELNLQPFDLEAALKNPERVVYRNGEKPLEWHWFEKCVLESHRLVTVQSNGDFASVRANGRVYENLKSEHCYDLMLLPIPEKRYWVNVYKDSELNDLLCCSHVVFDSEDEAKYGVDISRHFIKTISFTI